MQEQLQQLLFKALQDTRPELAEQVGEPSAIQIERSRDAAHGDFATNLALTLAKPAQTSPRELASQLCEALQGDENIERTEVAGPGFINFFLKQEAVNSIVARVLEQGETYGRSNEAAGRRVHIEFVSANPTGPLHVGHGRGAAYGDCVTRLLAATGHTVHREYYVNDAGRQMDILATSVWLRYLELCGCSVQFPPNAYQGDYIRAAAGQIKTERGDELAEGGANLPPPPAADSGEPAKAEREAHLDELIAHVKHSLGGEDYGYVLDKILTLQLDDIRDDLDEFRVEYDEWFSERGLVVDGRVSAALAKMEQADFTYERDGALWFKSSDYGDEKDRVLVRDNGQPTYFASDVAYHLDKLERGFDLLIDIWGADHHGYMPRVKAAVQALAGEAERVEINLVQFAVLFRGKKKLSMSTRAGEYVTLRQLRAEVGVDAARYFYIMRSNEQHLDFDLELATSQSNENPVYYIQYAHARICSVEEQLAERGLGFDRTAGLAHLQRLAEPHEQALIGRLARYPEAVSQASRNRAPHTVAHFLRDLADDFHSYYNAHQFLVEDATLRDARLALVYAVRQVLRNGLDLIGVSAPTTM